MSKIVVYAQEVSPPSRTVLMVAHAVGVKVQLREINVSKGEHLSPEYLKLNPLHTIPTMDDNGFILVDSHAIITYLVEKYAKDDSLYPKDLQKRALINQFLFFDSGTFFAHMKNALKPIFLENAKTVADDKLKVWKEAYEGLNTFLEGKKWLVGDSITLADYSAVTTAGVGSLIFSLDQYPNVKAWLQRAEKEMLGYKQCNLPGINQLIALFRTKTA